jgi:hypothetical protein
MWGNLASEIENSLQTMSSLAIRLLVFLGASCSALGFCITKEQ